MISKKIIERNFSSSSKTYDINSDIHEKIAIDLLNLIDDNKYQKILEIGCGTGILTVLLENKFPSSVIDAVDISKEMIEVASFKTKNVNYIHGDIEKIDLEKYDLIISSATMQWMTDLRQTVKKLLYSLRNSGVIYFSMFGSETYKEFFMKMGYDKNPYLNFYSMPEIKELFDEMNLKYEVDEKIYFQNFQNLYSFLKYVKSIGANTTEHQKKKNIGNILKIIKGSKDSIDISNQVLFCRVRT